MIKLKDILNKIELKRRKEKFIKEFAPSSTYDYSSIKNGPAIYNHLINLGIGPEYKYKNFDIIHLYYKDKDGYDDYFLDLNQENKIVLNVKYKVKDGGFLCTGICKLDGYNIKPIDILFNYYLSKYNKFIFDDQITKRGFSFCADIIKEALDCNYKIYFEVYIIKTSKKSKSKIKNPPKELKHGINLVNDFLKDKSKKYIKYILNTDITKKFKFSIIGGYIEK